MPKDCVVWCYKTSHNASPCFLSISTPSGEQEQEPEQEKEQEKERDKVSLQQTSGVNLLSSFYVIYIYSFQCCFSQQNVYKIMAREVFFSNNPLYFSFFFYQHRNLFEFKIIWLYFNPLYSSLICRHFTKKMSTLMTIVKHLLHQGRKGHLYMRRLRFCGMLQ